jgi:hypothetical protein
MLYFFATLGVAFVGLFLLLAFTWKNGMSPMPTKRGVKEALLEHLPDLERGTVVELGSGWGNLLFPLSKKYETCSVIGYENSPILYLVSSILNHKNNLQIFRKDFYEKSLQEANLVVCYLFPKGMDRLREKLERELKPGTKVVSHTFEIPNWTPSKTINAESSTIFLYEVT